MGFVWLEILSIGDQNGGEIKGKPEQIAAGFAHISMRNRPSLAAISIRNAMTFMEESGWISLEKDRLLISNYADYHRSREPKESRKGVNEAPSEPSEPSEPYKENIIKESLHQPTVSKYDPDFEAWWINYRQYQSAGKFKAHEEWQHLRKNGGIPTAGELMEAVDEDAVAEKWLEREKSKIPHARTWLHQRRWENVRERREAGHE